MKLAVLAALLSLALAGAVRAQEPADDAKKAAVLEEARQHVAKAKVHYDLGEYKEAADEYIIVYRLRPIPALLYNVAQAYRQGGIYDKARQFYKSYLREVPEAKNRATIEQSIHEMDELLAKEKKTREAAPQGVKETAEASLPAVKAPAAKPAETPPLPAPEKVAAAPLKPVEPVAQPAPRPAPEKVTVTLPKPAPEKAAPARPQPDAVAVVARPSAPPAAIRSTPSPAATVEEDDSIFKKWWLWTAVGVVAVGAGAAALTLGGNAAPTSHFGTTPVFP